MIHSFVNGALVREGAYGDAVDCPEADLLLVDRLYEGFCVFIIDPGLHEDAVRRDATVLCEPLLIYAQVLQTHV